MSSAPLYDAGRLASTLAAAGFDAALASTAPNVRRLTRFRKPGPLALVSAAEPAAPALIVSAADVDFLAEDLADGVEAHAYGTFYRSRAEGVELTAAEQLVERVDAAARREASAANVLVELLAERGLAEARIAIDGLGLVVAGGSIGEVRLEHAPELFRELRAVKTEAEIERLREAARIAEAAISATADALRPGAMQHELEAVFCASVVEAGARIRLANVSLGRSSALGNANQPDDTLTAGDIVRFDVGAIYDGYCSDLSRCFAFGEAPPRAAAYHAALVSGQAAALDLIRAGTRAADVFTAAVEAVRGAGIGDYERTNVGHGIGLAGDGYDLPLLAPGDQTVLEPGMVLCVETPYYELGFAGLQVEDMVVVTDDGWEPLSHLPRKLEVL